MVRRSAQSRSKFTRETRRRIKAQFPNAFHLRPFWGADGMLNVAFMADEDAEFLYEARTQVFHKSTD